MDNKKNLEITPMWLEVKRLIKDEKWEKLEDQLDLCLIILSTFVNNNYKDKDLIEKVKLETWFERIWITIQKYIWPLRPDYEENWKC